MVHAPPQHPATRRRGSADKAMANRRSSNNGGGAPASNQGSSPLNQRERHVGQFVLSKTMGEGTFGEVKLAVHGPTSERVAAKVRTRCDSSGMLVFSVRWKFFFQSHFAVVKGGSAKRRRVSLEKSCHFEAIIVPEVANTP